MIFHDPQRQDQASRIRAQHNAIEIERLRLEVRLRAIEILKGPTPQVREAGPLQDADDIGEQELLPPVGDCLFDRFSDQWPR